MDERAQKRVLQSIFGVLTVLRNAIQRAQNSGRQTLAKHIESRALAMLGGSDQTPLVQPLKIFLERKTHPRQIFFLIHDHTLTSHIPPSRSLNSDVLERSTRVH